jgi:hypothetical protein
MAFFAETLCWLREKKSLPHFSRLSRHQPIRVDTVKAQVFGQFAHSTPTCRRCRCGGRERASGEMTYRAEITCAVPAA